MAEEIRESNDFTGGSPYSPPPASGGPGGVPSTGSETTTRTAKDNPLEDDPIWDGWTPATAQAERSVVAPTGSVQRSSGTDRMPIAQVQLVPRGGVTGKELRIQRWLGLMTRPQRGQAPRGALADMRNLVVNKKTGAMSLRFGSSEYTLPTTDVSGAVGVSSGSNFFVGEFNAETPSSVSHLISRTLDLNNSNAPTILQKNFFPNSSTVNTGAVKWGETLSGVTLIAGISDDDFSFVGGVNVANYYKYWLCFNSTRSEYVYVNASTHLAGTTTITATQNIPSDWTTGDSLVFYRHFHDNPTFVPYYTSPIALQQGQGILFSGGQSSNVGAKPILSTYISKTLFSGATKALAFTGTYVTEAEVKSTAGFSGGACSAFTSSPGLSGAYRWFMAYVLQTDDGQRSQLIHPSTRYADPTSAQGIQNTVTLTGAINKRMRYLHVFLGFSEDTAATTLDWALYNHVKTYDLTDGTTFAYTESTTTPGFWSATIQLNDSDWQARGEDATVFLGHTEADNTTVSFSKALFVNNRLFVARYYDYTAAQNYDDQIRYSVFASNGVAQLNVLANVPEATESQVEPGDPAVIRGLARYEDKLFIVKDNSCYYIQIDPEPGTWSLVTVARIGSDSEGSIVATPFGIVFAKTGEDVYLWDGGYPRPLTRHWQATFAALTLGSAWYEWETRSYNILTDVASATTWYSMSFDVLVDNEYAWVKHHTSTIVNAAFSGYDSSRYPVFTAIDDATRIVYRRISTATTDKTVTTAGIAPYFKTAPIVLDERHVSVVNEWHLALEGIAGGSGTLNMKLTTSGAVGSAAQTYSNVSKTETLHIRKANWITGRGRQIEFEYNTNGTPATFTGLQVNELGMTFDIVQTHGDSVKTA